MSAKSMYIDCLIHATGTVASINKSSDTDYVSYLTSNGMVVGKKISVNTLEFEDQNTLQEEMRRRLDAKIPVNVFDLALGMYNHMASKKETDVEDYHQSIILEDVQILTEQSNVIKLDYFVLFADQIVGVIPAKVDLNNFR